MCTAYKVGVRGHVPDHWGVEQGYDLLIGSIAPRIVRPTYKAPLVMPDGTMREMTWGFRRKVPAVKSKTRWQTIVNSREDKLGGRTWSGAFRERRCLIPAYSFFEWVRNPAGGMMNKLGPSAAELRFPRLKISFNERRVRRRRKSYFESCGRTFVAP